MLQNDGTVRKRIADLATYALMHPWAHPTENTAKPQTGWIKLPALQIAVADTVARDHRVIEVEAAVGRYTSSVTCIVENSAIAVDLDYSLVGTVASYFAFVLMDTARLLDTQSFRAPEDVHP